MNITIIIVLVIGVAFIVVGPIIGQLATKASEKAEKDINNSKNN